MRFFILIRVVAESFRLALQQMLANKLRTFLSLLGITIGIWCIIMVFSAVDSLEANIRSSFDKLGDDVVYVTTMPWGEDPRENFWKYMRRPEPSFTDFKTIKRNCKSANIATISVFIGGTTTAEASKDFSGQFEALLVEANNVDKRSARICAHRHGRLRSCRLLWRCRYLGARRSGVQQRYLHELSLVR